MQIIRPGTCPSMKGPAAHFTAGPPRLDPAFEAVAAGRVSGSYVSFEPYGRAVRR